MASVWTELKRRNVVKVAMAYAIVGWLLIEIASTVLPTFDAPRWTLQTLTFVIILAFPLALVFAWAFEITPEGLKREKDVDPEQSITHHTGRKLNYAIIALLSAAVIFLLVDRLVLDGNATRPGGMPNSIAVLPFSNESAAAENAEFFANGIHDEILTQLARIGSLRVISRTSVMEYRDTTKNLRQIGAELGAATILEGRVQRAGDRVRINVQLINAETDEHLWAEIYDRELTTANIFAMQSEMARSIADALKATLTPQEVARLNELPTGSTRAYDFYLSALQYNEITDRRNNLPLAIQQLERAIGEDPGFALAYASLSKFHAYMYWLGFDIAEARKIASLSAAVQALELQPDLPEAHLAMAYYRYRIEKDFDEAWRELEIAAPGLPGDITVAVLRANINKRIGRWDEALADAARVIELDPRNAQALINSAVVNCNYRNYAECERIYDRVLEIAPDSETARVLKALVYWLRDGDMSLFQAYADDPRVDDPAKSVRGWSAAYYARDTELALQYLADWGQDYDIGIGGESYTPKSTYYGRTYAAAGQQQLARAQFEAGRAEIENMVTTHPDDFRFHVALAEILAGIGDREGALRAAEMAMNVMPPTKDAVEGRMVQLQIFRDVFAVLRDGDRMIPALDDFLGNPGGNLSIEGLLPDPRLDFIRDDPRFLALVEKYRRR